MIGLKESDLRHSEEDFSQQLGWEVIELRVLIVNVNSNLLSLQRVTSQEHSLLLGL